MWSGAAQTKQTYLFAFRIFPTADFLTYSWWREYPHSSRVPISSLVLLKCLGERVEYLINSHSLGSRWLMQRTNPASRWDLKGLQRIPADFNANSDPSLPVEGKMRGSEALWAVWRLNFLPKINSNEINYSMFSGDCRDGRIRLYFQPKGESLWMVGMQHLLSAWQHSLLLLLRLMERCWQRSAAGLSSLLSPPQTNRHACVDWMLMDCIVYAKAPSTLQGGICFSYLFS